MTRVRGHYRRSSWFRSPHYVRPHYRRTQGTEALMIVGGVLLVAFVILVLARAT